MQMISINEPEFSVLSCVIETRKNGPGWRPPQRDADAESEERERATAIKEDADGLWIGIRSPADIVTARQHGRALAIALGFEGGDTTLIVTVISEVARNIVDYAKEGEILIKALQQNDRTGVLIVGRDTGPGFPDVARAVQYGCLTRKGLGMGLPGVRWLVDEFEIVSQVGTGTKVTIKKWKKRLEL
jgi:serine/threonine-protein kinase RsbT